MNNHSLRLLILTMSKIADFELMPLTNVSFGSDTMGNSPKARKIPMQINKVAVLGAGTMGSRIAAHLANAGIPSYLLDLGSGSQTANKPGERNPERDKIVLTGLEGAKKSKPAAFFAPAL